jgi:hypothetical protein
MKLIDVEDALDLRQESRQQSEVATTPAGVQPLSSGACISVASCFSPIQRQKGARLSP